MSAYYRFSSLEHKLSIELCKIESILAPPSFDVDLREELSNEFDDLREHQLVGIVVWRIFETRFEKERITSESGCRFREVSIQFQLPRIRMPFRVL